MSKLIIPISFAGRKYGYITWKKKNDDKVRLMFGNNIFIDFKTNKNRLKKKKIDWKRRRISITISFTRSLPDDIEYFVITKLNDTYYQLNFK
jgi:hypothetical protein